MGRTRRKRRIKSRATMTNFSTDNEDFHGKLKEWMLSNKWKATCNLIPHVFESTGRGLMTLDKVRANQTVLQIPKSLLITTSTVSQSSFATLFSPSKSYSSQCVLSIFLIYEKHLEQLSFWKPYLDTLPKSYTNPEYCKKTEKKCLPYFISNELDTVTERLKSSYASLVESIKPLANKICNHCKRSYYDIFTYHKFMWAYYTVNTRAIYFNNKDKCSINIKGDDNLALAPFLDLFNHSFESVADAICKSFPNEEDRYEIVALKAYDPKMQVFINYGAHSNLKLYLEYGFLIPDNPLDQIFFTLSDIQKCHQISASAYNFIKMNAYEKDMAFTIEGLNYRAKNVLFVVTSDVNRESLWKEKMYRENFNRKDLQLLTKLGCSILLNKRDEFVSQLSKMSTADRRSESFLLAINLVKEHLKVIEKSLKSMKLSFKEFS